MISGFNTSLGDKYYSFKYRYEKTNVSNITETLNGTVIRTFAAIEGTYYVDLSPYFASLTLGATNTLTVSDGENIRTVTFRRRLPWPSFTQDMINVRDVLKYTRNVKYFCNDKQRIVFTQFALYYCGTNAASYKGLCANNNYGWVSKVFQVQNDTWVELPAAEATGAANQVLYTDILYTSMNIPVVGVSVDNFTITDTERNKGGYIKGAGVSNSANTDTLRKNSSVVYTESDSERKISSFIYQHFDTERNTVSVISESKDFDIKRDILNSDECRSDIRRLLNGSYCSLFDAGRTVLNRPCIYSDTERNILNEADMEAFFDLKRYMVNSITVNVDTKRDVVLHIAAEIYNDLLRNVFVKDTVKNDTRKKTDVSISIYADTTRKTMATEIASVEADLRRTICIKDDNIFDSKRALSSYITSVIDTLRDIYQENMVNKLVINMDIDNTRVSMDIDSVKYVSDILSQILEVEF
jgi:hypothetical protein